MMIPAQFDEYYTAFINKDPEYEGIFYIGVKTTGIFCRPTCAARKPLQENCEFFKSIEAAMLAGYRPCKRCSPQQQYGQIPDLIQSILNLLQQDPHKRWTAQDLRENGYDPSTIRRQFQKYFGMTFIQYARALRLGEALKTIRSGEKIIDAQLEAAYESGSGFRDAFTKLFGSPPQNKHHITLYSAWIETPLGAMLAIADETHLHLLEFTNRRGLEKEIERLRAKQNAAIIPGHSIILDQIESELDAYFKGNLQTFQTPVKLYGSAFQQSVLKALMAVPYGETRSYAQQAAHLENPKAVRAVARGNGMNQLAIIIPCHRIIGSDGTLTGYAGGLARKKWLLEHEIQHKNP